jgi:hypothetical protein
MVWATPGRMTPGRERRQTIAHSVRCTDDGFSVAASEAASDSTSTGPK